MLRGGDDGLGWVGSDMIAGEGFMSCDTPGTGDGG